MAYQTQDYKKAIEKYKEALEHNPDLCDGLLLPRQQLRQPVQARPQGRGRQRRQPAEAIDYYKKATETITDNPKLRKLSARSTCWRPMAAKSSTIRSQAEPIVKKMIEMDPNEPTNYYALAKIYEDAGNYEEAEKMLIAARDRRPKDPTIYMQLAGFYNRQGQFDKTIEALESARGGRAEQPRGATTRSRPTSGTRPPRLPPEGGREARLPRQRASTATNKAIAIKGDYLEAIVYKGLLLRLQANIEKDRTKQQALLKEADALRDRAKALQKAKQAGAGA